MRKAEFNPDALMDLSHRAAAIGSKLPLAGHCNLKACWKMRRRHCAIDGRPASWGSDFQQLPKGEHSCELLMKPNCNGSAAAGFGLARSFGQSMLRHPRLILRPMCGLRPRQGRCLGLCRIRGLGHIPCRSEVTSVTSGPRMGPVSPAAVVLLRVRMRSSDHQRRPCPT